MADLLFELFSEEIPARMQRPALETLTANLEAALKEARLEFSSLKGYVTPRRIAFLVQGLPLAQPDIQSERKGPATNAPQAALDGFLRSTGLNKEQLEIRLVGKQECYFAAIEEKGKPTKDALLTILNELIRGYTWPKSMRWNNHDVAWVRPLKNICCILDSDIIPVSFGPVSANNKTYGHRFMAPAEITLTKPADYEALLSKAYVIADTQKREAEIQKQMEHAAASHKLAITEDRALLEEVTGLVEWPTVMVGAIDDAYMDLPPEVLRSEMRNHQKYFSLQDAGGKMAAQFLITSNLIASDGGKAIIHGNERVLRARLADGRFYWDQDRKKPLSDWATGLKDVVFHAKLGSMAYRVERIKEVAAFLCDYVPAANKATVNRAAVLAKADLVSGMVGEFPELQGIMGRYYALAQGEKPEIADAIRDHYLPLGPQSPCPTEATAVTIALAEKIDALAGLFAVGEKPTGSKDPFALRRAALGVIRIILENNLRLPLRKTFQHSIGFYINLEGKTGSNHDIAEDLTQFFMDRFRVMLRGDGIRHDVLSAILDGNRDDDLVSVLQRVKALEHFLKSDEAANLLAAYNRANNIVRIERKKNAELSGEPVAHLLKQDEEKLVFDTLGKLSSGIASHLQSENYESAFTLAATMRQPMDAFFDRVTVQDENGDLRRNRLLLLAKVSQELHKLADFEKIEQ